MNFFPGLYQTREAKRSVSFSNPLTGQIYNNKSFAKNFDLQTRSSSRMLSDYNQTIKKDDLKKHERQRSLTNGLNQMSIQQKKKFEKQIKAISTTTRLAQTNKKSIFCRRSEIVNFQDLLLNKKHKIMNQTTPLQSIHFSTGNTMNIKKRKTLNQQKIAEEVFHQIQILILDIIQDFGDLQTKIVRMNLQKYFRSFFKKQLTGIYTTQFLNKVQFYLRQIVSQKSYAQVIDPKNYSPQIFSIVTRISFLNKIEQLQARNSQYSLRNIFGMIRYFCIPSQQFRQSCLRDINLMLSLQIYQKFNCSKSQEYVLLDQTGKQIQDILQIVFSTKKLFFSKKAKAHFNYSKYVKMINQYYNSQQKFSFNQGLKHNFRKKIAKGSYDESLINYHSDPDQFTLKRKQQVQRAQIILKKKVQLSRLNNNVSNPAIQKTIQLQQQSQIQTFKNNTQNLEDRQHKNIFWREGSKFISPDASPRNQLTSPKNRGSVSPKRQTFPLKEKQISKSKFKSLISFQKGKGLTKRLQQKFQTQYKSLVAQNDFYDISFNHRHENKLSLDSWKNNFVYFKDKSQNQINKIIQALAPFTQINTDSSIKNGQESSELCLNFSQYKSIRCIIQCFQPAQNIMKFVACYLNFNQFGQLTKQGLLQEMKIILQNNQIGVIQVILQVIWSWFQTNSVLDNKVIRRIVLQSWFQKYKIVYCMLVSLIFGTNHTTALDLAYQILH